MVVSVTVLGQERVERTLRKLKLGPQFLDPIVRNVALQSMRPLVKGSQTKRSSSTTFNYMGHSVTAKNLATGNTARSWKLPKKLAPAVYEVSNAAKTEDKRHLIVNILDKGRRRIRPKRKRALFMPLTRKGQRKRPGAAPAGLTMFKDFIFLREAKAIKGRRFIKKIVDEFSKRLTQNVLRKIRSVI